MGSASPAAPLVPAAVESVVVIQRGRLPTTDYLVLPYVTRYGARIEVVDSPSGGAIGLLAPGTLVVFVRYVEHAWMARIEAALQGLAGLAYFMDDDLLDLAALRGLPPAYALRIFRLALARRPWLRRVGAKLWVASPYLACKYRSWDPLLVEPRPAPGVFARSPAVRFFYHGTASHETEIRWLAPVVRGVIEREPRCSFEIFGPAWVNRLYRGVPRVAVLHPMTWSNYLAYSASADLHVGLAPLLPGRFNAARGYTKFFDFVRCGAVGIYSKAEPYASFVRDGVDGLLVENDAGAWRDAILSLAGDGDLRQNMADAARERALVLAGDGRG